MSSPHNSEFSSLENDIFKILRNIEFRIARNDFQDKFKEDKNEIHSTEILLFLVDKSATSTKCQTQTLHEKCPNTEYFLVPIFPHSDLIQRDAEYLSVFSPNAGKYVPEKNPYLNTPYLQQALT